MKIFAIKSVLELLLALVFLFTQTAYATTGFNSNESASSVPSSSSSSSISTTGLLPVQAETQYYYMRILEAKGDRRRRLAPFQLCLSCKCCAPGGDPTSCTNMPCCFRIDCDLPDKPFGTCAFVPNSCNCATCATSTSSTLPSKFDRQP